MKVLKLTVLTLFSNLWVLAQNNIDLVFIVDGSLSIDAADWELQKRGISIAIQNSALVPRDGSMALAVVQFSTPSPRTEVPYTIIYNQTDVDTVEQGVMAMEQIASATNPGDAIYWATELLAPSFRPTASQKFCLSTDELRNQGAPVEDAIAAAKSSSFGLESFGVIAIENGYGALESDFQGEYGPLVFGGGSVVVVKNSADFANTFGFTCLPRFDTELVGLEVIQVTQDLTNSVALVQDKATLVRAYVQPADSSESGLIQIRLRGRRDGIELPDSPLSSNSSGGVYLKADVLERRNILDDSFNFILPQAWLSGTVELEIQGVGTSLKCSEAAGPVANDCKATVSFQAVPMLEVKLIRIRSEARSGTMVESDFEDLGNLIVRLLGIYPISSFSLKFGFLDMGPGKLNATDVNVRIEGMRVLDSCIPSEGCATLYYGAVDQGGQLVIGPYLNDTILGLANDVPGDASCGIIADGNEYGRFTHAHEMAHTMGVHHAVTATIDAEGNKVGVCGEVASANASDFPFFEIVNGNTRATIGPLFQGADSIVFGWDSIRKMVIDPTKSFELMSYCGSQAKWISKYTYSSLLSIIQSKFSRRARKIRKMRSRRNLRTSYTVIRALINLDARTTSFLPAFQVGLSSAPVVNSTEYEVVGLNVSGGENFRVAVDPITFSPVVETSEYSIAEVNTIYVQAFVESPVIGTIASVHVEQGGSVLGNSQSLSSNAPTVTVISPNGGESLSGATTTISWSASDPDGDTLSYFVLFSPDAGATWKTLITDYLTTSLEVPLDALGQTYFGLIRVQASDGFNTAEDVSDGTFITPNIPPKVQILSPSNGTFYAGAQLMVFQASSIDVEDGEILDYNFVWTSDIDGYLGYGRTMELLASDLSENNHTITLTGSDSHRAMAVATVNFAIYRIAPILLAAPPSTSRAPTRTLCYRFVVTVVMGLGIALW